MPSLIFILFLFLQGVAAPAGAEEASVILTVENRTVSMGDRFTMRVTVRGTRPPEIPQLFNVGSFDVQKSGTTSRMRIDGGVVSGETVFSFQLSPKSPGLFVIGPAQITVEGKTFQSGQTEITVYEAAAGAVKAEASPYFITAEVDNPSPYAREQIRYTMKFFYRTSVGNAQLTLPDFSRFVKEELKQGKQSDQVVQGVNWHVTEYNLALFPIAAGAITIPSSVLAVDVAAGRSARRVTLHSNPVTLSVSRPPVEGRPKEYTGLVGQVKVTGTVSKRALKTGESATLTLLVEGDADLRGFQLAIPPWTDFKVYEDKPTFQIEANDNKVTGRKRFQMAVIPEKEGGIAIPKVTISYLDPKTKRYRFAETAPILMNISSGESSPSSPVVTLGNIQKKNVTIQGRDLMPIKRKLDSLDHDSISPDGKKAIWATLFVGLPIYLLLFVLQRRRDRLLGDPARMRRNLAYRRFKAALTDFGEDDLFFEQASAAFRTYLGDRFNVEGGALTVSDISRKLMPWGVSKEMIQKMEVFFQACDAARYGGREESRDDFIATLTSLVNEIEKGSATHSAVAPSIVFFLIFLPVVSFAQEREEIPSVFLQANQAYEAGDYKKAQALYGFIQKQGIESGEIHFNLGNAYFRDNQLGRAIFHLKEASRLSPRDPDIEYNLAFAREKVTDRIEYRGSFWLLSMGETVTQREAYFLLLFFCVLAFLSALLALYLKRSWAAVARNILFLLFASSMTFVVSRELTAQRNGVVLSPEVSVYSGPGRDNVVLFSLHEGAEFTIVDTVESGWAAILLADGKKGWISAENILF